MNQKMRLVVLWIVVVGIVGGIWYLQSRKASPAEGGEISGDAPSVTLPTDESIASTTVSASGTAPSGVVPPRLTLSAIAAADQKAGYKPAVEIVDPTGFINTDALKLSDIVGKKVILVDFWTYSCINCIRTLPHLTALYDKYKAQGLEIVGIHTPEFEFEKNYDNVKAATVKYGIKYPVVLDSNYGTWQAYGNRYWPRHYLIDIAGYVVANRIGEGGYDETEAKVKKLLADRAAVLGVPLAPVGSATTAVNADLTGVESPETYFGAGRNDSLGNGTKNSVGSQTLTTPATVNANRLYLVGDWNFTNEYAANTSAGAKIIYKYKSDKVYFVASAPKGVSIQVLQDGQPVTAAAGSDVKDGKATIKDSRAYQLIDNPSGPGQHTLEIIIDGPGLEAYTFTFG